MVYSRDETVKSACISLAMVLKYRKKIIALGGFGAGTDLEAICSSCQGFPKLALL